MRHSKAPKAKWTKLGAARAAKILKLYTPVGFTQSLVPSNPVISEFTDDKSKSLRVGRVVVDLPIPEGAA